MKIVKDGLYMYNDGMCVLYVVKATKDGTEGVDGDKVFEGVVVFDLNSCHGVGSIQSTWCFEDFKRLDNKITTGE